MPGNARIMTYDDIVEAEQKRAAKVGVAGAKRAGDVLKAQRLMKGKDRVQMSWRLAIVKFKHLGWRSIVLSCNFEFLKLPRL
jgi:hypothetical protein